MKALFLMLAGLLAFAGCSGLSGDDGPTATTLVDTATATISANIPATATTADATATSVDPTATATSIQSQPTPTDIVIDVRTPGTAQPSPTTAPVDTAGIQEQLAEILANTATIRELQPQGDIPAIIISREQLRENLIALLEADYSQAKADADTLEFWLLRLLPERDLDLYQLQLDLLSEQVAGYYDPETDELYIVSDAGTESGLDAASEYTASHEYVHAIQDQYFDLEEVHQYQGKDTDRDAGASALIEGDASLSSTLYLFQYMGIFDTGDLFSGEVGSTDVIDNAPAYVSQSLIFPYEKGVEFVTQLYLTGGNDAINAALEDPPTSTEQILHPEKYTAAQRDEPREVTLPALAAALGSGWSETDNDTLGEFDFQVMLAENGAPDPEAGAAGWGGARYALLQNGNHAVVALSTLWDSPAEAAEFHQALLATLPSDADPNGVVNDGERFLGVALSGDGVVYVAGTDADAVSAALAVLGGAV